MIASNSRVNFLKICLQQYKRQFIYSRIIFKKNYFITNKIINKSNLFSTSSVLSFTKNKSESRYSDNITTKIKFLAVFITGALIYFIYVLKSKEKPDNFVLDLNEIYESCAILFLSNPELQDALGIPIKITSSENDLVREIHLRRHGDDLFSFISYRLKGAYNNGTVYCKLKMIKDTQKFKSIEIILKLDKKHKNKKEIIIMSEPTKKTDEKDL